MVDAPMQCSWSWCRTGQDAAAGTTGPAARAGPSTVGLPSRRQQHHCTSVAAGLEEPSQDLGGGCTDAVVSL
ncbi:hypothetical protein C2E20_3288 [Micractinium conductrix]|uniref:Uncharacterized protein n=1 Tax=Micractinium conductrix TaxID=554055 RepID=A0A2P6VH90_9CHLO|nr:hypothetical protein C2E20_3288 [Micractinium conductrix]|eukprot:PSC73453.1 hypothetical protein C2E20_3288 [Micractinium conductrix]